MPFLNLRLPRSAAQPPIIDRIWQNNFGREPQSLSLNFLWRSACPRKDYLVPLKAPTRCEDTTILAAEDEITTRFSQDQRRRFLVLELLTSVLK